MQAKKLNYETLSVHLSLSGLGKVCKEGRGAVLLFKLQTKLLKKFLTVLTLPICSPHRVKVGELNPAPQFGACYHCDQLLELRHIIRNPVTQQRSECTHTFVTPCKLKADQKIIAMTNKSHHAS